MSLQVYAKILQQLKQNSLSQVLDEVSAEHFDKKDGGYEPDFKVCSKLMLAIQTPEDATKLLAIISSSTSEEPPLELVRKLIEYYRADPMVELNGNDSALENLEKFNGPSSEYLITAMGIKSLVDTAEIAPVVRELVFQHAHQQPAVLEAVQTGLIKTYDELKQTLAKSSVQLDTPSKRRGL